MKKYGIVSNKTNIIGETTSLDEKYYISFIRGLFDADGSIMFWKNGNSLYWSVSICKTPALLKFVEKTLKYNWLWSQRKEDNRQCQTITINRRKETIDCLHQLYDNATVYLDRKYERYLEVINAI